MPFFRSDDLVILMPLAGQQDYVTRLGIPEDPLDGEPPVDLAHDRLATIRGKPGLSGVDDLRRVFGARVVAGDVDRISQLLGHLRHARAFLRVPVPAATE